MAWVAGLVVLLISYGIGSDGLAFGAFAVIVVSVCFTPGAVLWWMRYESVRRTGWRAVTVQAVIVREPAGCLAALAAVPGPSADPERKLDYVVRFRDGDGARLRGGASLWHRPPPLAFDRAQPGWVGGTGRSCVVLFAGGGWGPRRPHAVPATFLADLPARPE
ncbi:hypothetical protein ACIOD2_47735 [Amycolatopsis sp. NPDC088138]|uniref:hypothetical protein n=1 Tax=Amycolatopsis sp. NPDC088138 TaxID=3363938 RepID=UPI00381F72A4